MDFRKAKAVMSDTLKDMDVDAAPQVVDDGEDLYTRLKVWQRQLEFYEIQVICQCVLQGEQSCF